MTGLKRKFLPSTPGAFEGLTIGEYITAPGLSRSVLMLMRDGCPAKFKAELDGQREAKETPAMCLGSALHAKLLDGEQLYHVLPVDVDLRTKAGKEWKEAHGDLPVLKDEQHRWITAAAYTVRNHALAWPILRGSRREVSLFAEYRGRLMKGRPDALHEHHISDIKTVADASDRGLSKAIHDFGWAIQAALYWKLAVILGFQIDAHYIIAIEKPANDTGGMRPLVNVKRLAPSSVEVGQHELDAMLDKVEECEKRELWPDYSGNSVGEIDLPRWAYPSETAVELQVAGKTITL